MLSKLSLGTEPPAEAHRIRVRVYWEDTDAGGVVFYANYLKFLERARTEWLRSCGIAQRTLQEQTGCIFVVAHLDLHYLQSARLDDVLQVTVSVQSMGKASMVLHQQVWRDSTLLCEGTVRIGCVDHAHLKPCRIPKVVLVAVTD